MKSRNIPLQHLRRIAFGIHGHQQHLQAIGIAAQLLHHHRHLAQRRRADIRAVRETEKHRDHLALEIGQRAALPVVVGQYKVPAEGGAGDIGQFEARRFVLFLTGGHRQQAGDDDQNRGQAL